MKCRKLCGLARPRGSGGTQITTPCFHCSFSHRCEAQSVSADPPFPDKQEVPNEPRWSLWETQLAVVTAGQCRWVTKAAVSTKRDMTETHGTKVGLKRTLLQCVLYSFAKLNRSSALFQLSRKIRELTINYLH